MSTEDITKEEDFKAKTLVQKINEIDKVINEKIRDFLQQDNGDLDLVHVEEKNDLILVYVEYQGACTSCESSGNTHTSIQNILQRMLSNDIRVLTV